MKGRRIPIGTSLSTLPARCSVSDAGVNMFLQRESLRIFYFAFLL
jgi:hypothetical protein